MFAFQHACGKHLGRVAVHDGHARLRHNLSAVDDRADAMDGDARFLVAVADDGLVHVDAVHVRPSVLGQQRRVDVEDATLVAADDGLGHLLHIAAQHHHVGPRLIERVEHGLRQFLVVGVSAAADVARGDPLATGTLEGKRR